MRVWRWAVLAVAIGVICSFAFARRATLRRLVSGPPPGPAALVGQAAPELPSLPTQDGPPLRLADRRGQVVLLHFWTYGCTIVDELLPRYGEWQQRFGPRGLAIVGVHTPEHPGETTVCQLGRLRMARPAWPIAFDAGLTSWPRFHVRDSPTVFLIDRDGRVRFVHAGAGLAPTLERELQSLL